MAEFGIGASVLRREDDRFLRGPGPYAGDVRMAGMREVAFVRSPLVHARLLSINIPAEYRDCVFKADNVVRVKPTISVPPFKGYKCQSSRRSRPARLFCSSSPLV